MSNAKSEPLLTVAQAAEALTVSVKTIRRRIGSGELAIVRIGSAIRIHPKELQRYIAANWEFDQSCPSETP